MFVCVYVFVIMRIHGYLFLCLMFTCNALTFQTASQINKRLQLDKIAIILNLIVLVLDPLTRGIVLIIFFL